MKIFCVALLVLSACVGSFQISCPSEFGQDPSADINFQVIEEACFALCTNCVTDVSKIVSTTTCLELTEITTNNDLRFLRKINTGFCVVVNASNIRKPLVFGDGNDCLEVFNASQLGQIITGDGNDFVYIGNDSKVNGKISTGRGDDVVYAYNSAVADVFTGPGNDVVDLKGTSFARNIDLGKGDDYLYSSGSSTAGANQIQEVDGSSGNDVFHLYQTTVIGELNAGAGVDYVALLNGTHIRRLDLGKGKDVLGQETSAQVDIDEVVDDDDENSDVIQCVIPM